MPNYPLDKIDLAILDQLQTSGRMTNQELADLVGLSPSPCLRRIRQLENQGVITGYGALIDPDKIGLSVMAFVRVRLHQQNDKGITVFESAVMTFPEVMECYLMSGEADYNLRVLVGSLYEFEEFLREKLTKIESVSEVKSSFALRHVVYKTAIPLNGLH
jgi:Lrp/AsnC family leucine-responsive transcriptional regulator